MPLLWTLVYIRARPVVAKLSYIRWWFNSGYPAPPTYSVSYLSTFVIWLTSTQASGHPREPLDVQARRVYPCRPRFRNGSMPPPDPLVDHRPLVSPLDI